jgi:hypothetical protein
MSLVSVGLKPMRAGAACTFQQEPEPVDGKHAPLGGEAKILPNGSREIIIISAFYGHALALRPARYNNWRRKIIYFIGLFFYLPKSRQLLSRKNGRRQKMSFAPGIREGEMPEFVLIL